MFFHYLFSLGNIEDLFPVKNKIQSKFKKFPDDIKIEKKNNRMQVAENRDFP